jgi:hypothetical protein
MGLESSTAADCGDVDPDSIAGTKSSVRIAKREVRNGAVRHAPVGANVSLSHKIVA